ncbi:MAG: N-acetyl-1-D-myo-inositol-2-amino-2-deoxy-alpha-D-glucopyranoside deacetylase [Propionibacteriaceae bacterium]
MTDHAHPPDTSRRLLLVHAHPDDESIGTGATMARYVAQGAAVTLVTCTLGEEGEVLADDLVHLGPDADDRLGEHRITELAAAMAALGVTDHLRLGGDHAFRDSGMAYDEQRRAVARDSSRHDSLWRTDLLRAANELMPVIRDRRPQVVVSYDQNGGYGHPDHVMAHRVATYATDLAGVRSYRPDLGEAWQVQRLLWTAIPAGRMRDMIRRTRESGDTEAWGGFDPDGDELPPMSTPDGLIDCIVDGAQFYDRKIAALRAHRSQIAADSWFLNVPGEYAAAFSSEAFRLAGGTPFPAGAVADDIFAGLA